MRKLITMTIASVLFVVSFGSASFGGQKLEHQVRNLDGKTKYDVYRSVTGRGYDVKDRNGKTKYRVVPSVTGRGYDVRNRDGSTKSRIDSVGSFGTGD